MTSQEIINEHKDNKCKKCNKKNCEGITVTLDNKARCDLDYER